MPLPRLNTNFNVMQPDVGKQAVRAAQVGNFLAQQKDAPLNRRIKEAQFKNILAERKRAEESEPAKQRKRVADVINVEGQNLIRAFEAPTKEIGAALLNKIDPDSTISWGGGFITIENEKKGYKLKVRQADAVNVAKMLADPKILDDKQGVQGLSNLQDLAGYLGGTGGELTIKEPPKTEAEKLAFAGKKARITAKQSALGRASVEEKKPELTESAARAKLFTLDKYEEQLESTGGMSPILFKLLTDSDPDAAGFISGRDKTTIKKQIKKYRNYLKGFVGKSSSDPLKLFSE